MNHLFLLTLNPQQHVQTNRRLPTPLYRGKRILLCRTHIYLSYVIVKEAVQVRFKTVLSANGRIPIHHHHKTMPQITSRRIRTHWRILSSPAQKSKSMTPIRRRKHLHSPYPRIRSIRIILMKETRGMPKITTSRLLINLMLARRFPVPVTSCSRYVAYNILPMNWRKAPKDY